jgi:hypothetical protein
MVRCLGHMANGFVNDATFVDILPVLGAVIQYIVLGMLLRRSKAYAGMT